MKSKFDSKKFTAMVVGISTTMFVFLVSTIAVMYNAEIASGMVNLATVVIGAITSVISLYAVGQSAVDWKINSNLSATTENKTSREHIIHETRQYEMQYDDGSAIDYEKL